MPFCKKCKQKIYWYQNDRGRWEPRNGNGSSHFDTCPYTNEFRGKSFKNPNEDYTKSIVPKGQKTLT